MKLTYADATSAFRTANAKYQHAIRHGNTDDMRRELDAMEKASDALHLAAREHLFGIQKAVYVYAAAVGR